MVNIVPFAVRILSAEQLGFFLPAPPSRSARSPLDQHHTVRHPLSDPSLAIMAAESSFMAISAPQPQSSPGEVPGGDSQAALAQQNHQSFRR